MAIESSGQAIEMASELVLFFFFDVLGVCTGTLDVVCNSSYFKKTAGLREINPQSASFQLEWATLSASKAYFPPDLPGDLWGSSINQGELNCQPQRSFTFLINSLSLEPPGFSTAATASTVQESRG
ncbi:tumor necrosis factor receptor superfamily member 16-like [Platysternon megacephalum]|uniref:Tumor necrosis factor receptor superfamily member 16-like n=1 Tax=Platysternon megacephalum TaxID=55544 RepID=A0A4D9DIS5_9SAUR|nr:tumor necrosis factor receptor superfamily member 16-like [Platysternon megacephalum]